MATRLHRPRGRYRLPNGMSVYGLSWSDTLNVYRDIFESDCYRRHGITVRDGDCVLDVGANTGLFVLFLNTLCRRAQVFAFEPIPAIFEVLTRNVRAHDRLGTTVINAGLADHDGEVRFTYYPRFSNASTMYPDQSDERARMGRAYILDQVPTLPRPLPSLIGLCPAWLKQAGAEVIRRYHLRGQPVTCRVQTLSGFLRERAVQQVDLLKIDAEGSERAILAGIEEAHWDRIRQLVMEVHDGASETQRIQKQLEGRGFATAVGHNPALPSLSIVYAVRPR
ncbi:MAG: FkbM family methyltransferase [Gemmataceae bacterium]